MSDANYDMRVKAYKEREKDVHIKSYQIAKEVAEYSNTYKEAKYICDLVKHYLDREMEFQAPVAPRYPIDYFDRKIEIPDSEEPGKKD